MKAVLISVLLAILPIVGQVNSEVSIRGKIDIRPGETTHLGAYPDNPSYTYVWDFEQNNVEANFSYSTSGSSITRTHLNKTQSSLLGVYCTVYDESGYNIGTGYTEIVVQF